MTDSKASITITKTMASEIDRLRQLADGVTDTRDALQAGFSNAQEQFAIRCGAIGCKFSESQVEAICAGIVGPDGERKSKASEARKWAHPLVAPKVEAIFKIARENFKGVSVVGTASKMATRIKDGKAKSPESAADQVRNAEAEKKAAANTPAGAKKRASDSVKKLLHAGGYQKADIEPVLAVIDALGQPSEPEVKKEKVATTAPAVSDALSAVLDNDADDALGAMLASLLEKKGHAPAEATLLAALLTK